MELFDEDFQVNEKTDNKKVTTIILAVIIFLIILVAIIVGIMFYIKATTLVVKLNGQQSNDVKNMLVFDEANNSRVYIPIRRIAKYLGYENYSGNYTTRSEEPNQCYVECENEVAVFTLGSNEVYKTIISDDDPNFECYKLEQPVKAIDGELYTTIEGIETAFNVIWNHDTDTNSMTIYTMPYLINGYSSNIVNLGYDTVSEDFNNQKAILDGFLVVEKNKKMAVLSVSSGNISTLLENKYDAIEYLYRTQDFLVTANGKKGIITKTKSKKVDVQYDDIKMMDYDKKLYLVENEGKFGVIKFSGEKLINLDYSQIGIDISNFKENDIKSKYILADNLIPVQYDKQWAFFDIKGKQVTDFKFSGVGCTKVNVGSGYNLLTVPDYNVIVVEGPNKKYSVITSKGEEIDGLPLFAFESIYLYKYGGKTEYKLVYEKKEYDLLEQLDVRGYGKTVSNTSDEEETDQTEDNSNNEENNNNESEQENNNNNNNNNNNSSNENSNNENNNENNNNSENNNNNNNNNDNNNNEQQNNNEEENNN